MKKIAFILFASLVLSACSSAPQMEITVTNPSATERSYETVEIAWHDITPKLAGVLPDNIVVSDASGKQVPSQVVYEGQAEPQKLIFQASLAGKGNASFTIGEGIRDDYPVQAFGRYVPERLDDYAWENNRVAYRAYGPALRDPKTPGIDVWVKSTERMVIDDWFAGKDYHTNHGEGMDAYKVGPTLGGGASAPLIDEKLWLSGNYATQERLDNGPIRTTVKLTYAPFTAAGASVALEKIISLDANSYFNRVTETYSGSFETIPIAVGVVLHDVKQQVTGNDYIAVTEALSDTKQPEVDGNISLGVILPGANETQEVQGHLLLVKNIRNGEQLVYWNGSGWSQAGIENNPAWVALLLQKREEIGNPLIVTLK